MSTLLTPRDTIVSGENSLVLVAGGSSELTSESEHHKDQQHENALAANMPQHFMVYHPFQMLFQPDITCLMGGA
jgi:hypothetical protein